MSKLLLVPHGAERPDTDTHTRAAQLPVSGQTFPDPFRIDETRGATDDDVLELVGQIYLLGQLYRSGVKALWKGSRSLTQIFRSISKPHLSMVSLAALWMSSKIWWAIFLASPIN